MSIHRKYPGMQPVETFVVMMIVVLAIVLAILSAVGNAAVPETTAANRGIHVAWNNTSQLVLSYQVFRQTSIPPHWRLTYTWSQNYQVGPGERPTESELFFVLKWPAKGGRSDGGRGDGWGILRRVYAW